ncbi:MAG: DUF2202 domain-containing protein [Pyrobaculum sp.]
MEIAAVLYMREVEKLARDLYLTLYNATGEKINLAESEQRHMDAVLAEIWTPRPSRLRGGV